MMMIVIWQQSDCRCEWDTVLLFMGWHICVSWGKMRDADMECKVATRPSQHRLLLFAMPMASRLHFPALSATLTHGRKVVAESTFCPSWESVACAFEIYVCSTTDRGREKLPSLPKNEPVKLTAEMFMEANDEQ